MLQTHSPTVICNSSLYGDQEASTIHCHNYKVLNSIVLVIYLSEERKGCTVQTFRSARTALDVKLELFMFFDRKYYSFKSAIEP